MTLDDGPLEKMSDWEPLTHSVLDVTLDGRPMEGIPDPEPLEHSVLVMALDSGLTEGMSYLEPLEHSVVVALVTRPMEGTPDREPLQHSVLNMALDDGLAQEGGEPMFGSDHGLTSTEIPDAMRTVDLGLGVAVPFSADDVDRVSLPPAEARLNDSGVCITDVHMQGFRCWNTDRDIFDQCETFNGLPVCYGGGLYDSEDSEWDEPNALAGVRPMWKIMVLTFRREWISWFIARAGFGMAQRLSRMTIRIWSRCVRWCHVSRGWDVFDGDSLTGAAIVDGPNMDDYYHRVVSLDEEDCIVSDTGSITGFVWDMSGEEELIDSDEGSMADLASDSLDVEMCCDSDAGSMADLEWNTWDDACALAFLLGESSERRVPVGPDSAFWVSGAGGFISEVAGVAVRA